MTRAKLIVATSSWHNRVYRYWAKNIATRPPVTVNLCLYMRAVLIYTPLAMLLKAFAFVCIWVLLTLSAALWVPFFLLYHHNRRFRVWADGMWERITDRHVFQIGTGLMLLAIVALQALDEWWMPFLILGILLAVAVGLAALLVIVHWLLTRREHKEAGANDGASARSLVWSWIKAKKERICPLIETRN